MNEQANYESRLLSNALKMRANPTEAETIFKERLEQSGVEFLNQAIIGRYIVDFVLPTGMLIVELDGTHHSHPTKVAYDQRRTAFLEGLGFTVQRIPNHKAGTAEVGRRARKAKKGAFEKAVKQAKRLMREWRTIDNQRLELKHIDRDRAKMIEANSARTVRVVRRTTG
jgi:very-short-patch-repair endonuclease